LAVYIAEMSWLCNNLHKRKAAQKVRQPGVQKVLLISTLKSPTDNTKLDKTLTSKVSKTLKMSSKNLQINRLGG